MAIISVDMLMRTTIASTAHVIASIIFGKRKDNSYVKKYMDMDFK